MFSLLFLVWGKTEAQQPADTTRHDPVKQYMIRWEKFIPRYSKLQVAGGMGVVSLGLGWDYGKNKQWETDLFVGYLPAFSGDHNSFTFTLKQNFIPWEAGINARFTFAPLTTGLYANRVSSNKFWTAEPDKYDGPYYRFATGLRFSAFLGQRISLHINKKNSGWKSVSLFYELSSNDLYISSYVENRKALSIFDILVLSFGLKLQIL